MTTAATLLTETLIPAAPAAAGVGASGGAPGQSLSTPPFASQFMTTFASLLAEGNFVQAPGMVPVESGGTPSLAALLSMGEAGAAADGKDVPADPAFNVIPLFDSTSLSTPAPVNPIPGLGLGVTTLISDGASSDGSNAAPKSDSSVAPPLAPPAADIPRSIPVDSDPGFPISPQPSLKGVTAADVMAEIAQFVPDGTGLIADTVEAAPVTPGGKRESTLAPLTAAPSAAPMATATHPQQASAAAGPPSAPTAPSLAAGAAATATSDGQAAREGEAPDPRVTSQIAQSGVPRPLPQARAVVGKAGAKPTAGLSPALSGDAALAAMAIETPKPSVTRPTAPLTPAAGQDASATGANPNPDGSDKPSSYQPSSQQQPQSLTGLGKPADATPGQAFEQASLGADPRTPMAEVSDQRAAPRAAVDARIESLQAAPQPLRGGEAAVQPERSMATPPPPPAPPAEQVAMQLRHAVAKGVDKITIQLSPASLGSIDVTLEVSSGSRVVVQVVVERADTLDLLRADARALERALQEAGLRTDSGSLNFNLRGDGDGAPHRNTAFDETGAAGGSETDSDADSDADGASHGTPTRLASDLTLDIEV